MNEGSTGDNWEKAETSSGILYYINHKGKQTQWEHPKFTNIFNSINECNSIKYAAYRTASKVSILQKILGLDKVRLGVISGVFQQHRILILENCLQLEYSELEAILYDIFFAASKEARLKPSDFDVDNFTELNLNFLISVFDKNRAGSIQVIGIKVALICLCRSRLQEKYQYLFNQLADHNSCLSKRKLKLLLDQFVSITDYLFESLSFSSSLIPDTIQSCFENQSNGQLGVSEENFICWVLKEPQLLVWLSTFYRLKAAENATHSVRCAVCRTCPIKGLRYRCLHCISYDQCQHCFFHGCISKKHKLKHPMQEYSWQATHKEATLSFLKALVNRICGNTLRLQYLPAQPYDDDSANTDSVSSSYTNSTISCTTNLQMNHGNEEMQQEELINTLNVTSSNKNGDLDNFDEGNYITIKYVGAGSADNDLTSQWNDCTIQPQKELQSIINKLEEENRQLELEIEMLCGPDQGRIGLSLKEHRSLVEAQVRRLKLLKQHLQTIVPKAIQSTPIPVQSKHMGLKIFKSPELSPICSNVNQTSYYDEQSISEFSSLKNDNLTLTDLTFGCLSAYDDDDNKEIKSIEHSEYSNMFDNYGVNKNTTSACSQKTSITSNNPEEQKQIEDLQQGLDNILIKLQNMLASNFSLNEPEAASN